MNTTMRSASIMAFFIFTAYYFGGTSLLGYAVAGGILPLIVVLFLLVQVKGFLHGQRTVDTGGSTGYGWIVFSALLFISYAATPAGTNGAVLALGTGAGLAVYLLACNTYSRESIPSILWILYILAAAIALIGLVNLAVHDQSLFSYVKRVYLNRLTATFINPNHCASFIGMVLPLGAYFCAAERKITRVVSVVCMLIILVGLFFTYSLGAFAALVCSGYVWFLLYDRFVRQLPQGRKVLLATMLCGICVLLAGGILYSAFGRSFAVLKYYSLWQRWGLYKGIFVFLGHQVRSPLALLFGYGLGSFPEVFQGFYRQYDVVTFLHAHNEYAELLIETGITGLAVFSLLWMAPLRHAVSLLGRLEQREDKLLVIALACGLVFFLVHMAVDFTAHVPLIMMTAALFSAAVRCMAAESGGVSPGKIGKGYLLTIFFIGTVMVASSALALYEYGIGYLLLRSETDALSGHLDRASRGYEQVGRFASRSAAAYEQIGEYYMYRATAATGTKNEYLEKAVRSFMTAAHLSHGLPRYLMQCAWAYVQAGEPDKAADYFNAAVDRNPYFLVAYLDRARFHFYNGEKEKARDDYRTIVTAIPAIPASRESKVRQLIDEVHGDLLVPAVRKEFPGLYATIKTLLGERTEEENDEKKETGT